MCSTIVLIEFGFCAETFAARSARIRLIASMQSIEFEVVEEIEKLVNVCAVGVIVIVIVAFFI